MADSKFGTIKNTSDWLGIPPIDVPKDKHDVYWEQVRKQGESMKKGYFQNEPTPGKPNYSKEDEDGKAEGIACNPVPAPMCAPDCVTPPASPYQVGTTLSIQEKVKAAMDQYNMAMEVEKAMASMLEQKKASRTLKGRAIRVTKAAAKKALVRKISRKLVKIAHSNALKLVESVPQLQMFAPYFNSKVGKAFVSGALAISIEFLPLPENLRDSFDLVKDSVVEELTVMAMDDGTAPLEKVAGLLLPGLAQSLAPLLSAPDIKKLSA